jgi:folate-binding protein YgfZ
MPDDLIELTREELARVRHGASVMVTEPAAFTVSGPGAVTCMQGLLTNDIERPGEESLVYGAMLTPKGMIVADMWVARSRQELTLIAHPGVREAMAETFQRTLPPRLARVSDQTGELRVAWLVGRGAFEALVKAGLGPLPDAAGRVTVIETVRGRLLVALGHDHTPFAAFLAGREAAIALALEVLAHVGVTPRDARLLDAARILAGWPRMGTEISERTLPQEVRFDEIGGVSYTKGCYTGQETVARVHFRGHVNRELKGLRWDHMVEPDDPAVLKDGKAIGTIGSTLLLDDRALALAMLKRETAIGETVDAGGRLATVVALPFSHGDVDG